MTLSIPQQEQWDDDKDKENTQPDEVDEYLYCHNKDYQDRFEIYLDGNMKQLKEISLSYECELCEKHLDRRQVHQVVKSVSQKKIRNCLRIICYDYGLLLCSYKSTALQMAIRNRITFVQQLRRQ
ncbi:8016_t:CDS:2, partial [Entrophospora sp. SA101]